ncbi:MAG: zinc ribbon domain-containing protein [Clostridia bacterium]|nr:zinc ribbon domain-containing protein [Clostridia bacterium]
MDQQQDKNNLSIEGGKLVDEHMGRVDGGNDAAPTPPRRRKCIYCGKPVPNDTNNCPHCGYRQFA